MTDHGKDPALVVHAAEPLNLGTPPDLLLRDPLTPVSRFFVRSHGPIPAVDPASFTLSVGGMVERTLDLSPGALAVFPAATVIATLQCAGLRRLELHAIRPIAGELPWAADAVGTAAWTGVRLADVLRAAGIAPGAAHVAFTSLGAVPREGVDIGFGGSIPLARALAPDVLLATHMNGAPLPPAHGFPLRVVVPGTIGARSVKWVGAVEVRATPSEHHFQARAYKTFPPDVDAASVDWSAGHMLGPLEVNSAILAPADGARLVPGPVTARGFALAGPDHPVARVEVTTDGGASWIEAHLEPGPGAGQPGVWRLWHADVTLAPGRRTIAARAWDAGGRTQPPDAAPLWNLKGYANNAWPRVTVDVAAP